MSVIDGIEIGRKLATAGLIPHNTKRIVIDIQGADAVVIYYETFASKIMMDVTIEALIQNKDKVKVIPVE